MTQQLPPYPYDFARKAMQNLRYTCEAGSQNPVYARMQLELPVFTMCKVNMAAPMPAEIANYLRNTDITPGEVPLQGHIKPRMALWDYYAQRYPGIFGASFNPDSIVMIEDARVGIRHAVGLYVSSIKFLNGLKKAYLVVPQFRWHGIDDMLLQNEDIGIIEIPQLPDGRLDMQYMRTHIPGRNDIAAFYRATPGAPDGAITSHDETSDIANFLQQNKIPFIEDVALERFTGDNKSPLPLLGQYSNFGVMIGKSSYMWRVGDNLNVGWIAGEANMMRLFFESMQITKAFKSVDIRKQIAMVPALRLADSYYVEAAQRHAAYNRALIDCLANTPLVPIRSQYGLSVTFDMGALVGCPGLSPFVSVINDAADFAYDMSHVCGVMPSPVVDQARTHIRFAMGGPQDWDEIGARVGAYCGMIRDDKIVTSVQGMRGGKRTQQLGVAFHHMPGADDPARRPDPIFGGLQLVKRHKNAERGGL